MEPNRRYTLMAFPQGFDGNSMKLNIVLIPRNRDPLELKMQTGLPAPYAETKSFADLVPVFSARILSSPDEFPQNNAADIIISDLPLKPVLNKRALLTAISNQFSISPSLTATDTAGNVIPVERSVAKYLPHSYRDAFNFTSPRHPNAKTDDSYYCALREYRPTTQRPYSDDVSWGKVFAHILRQPKLAIACGMIYETVIDPCKPEWFKNGGYIYIEMNNPGSLSIQTQSLADPLGGGPFIKQYAARIPALTQAKRPVFAPVLFPVLYPPYGPPKGEWDKIFAEVQEYDEGFAKIVHANQPVSANMLAEEQDGIHPVKDVGIRLGWDDEQILIWYIRQLSASPDDPGNRVDAPLGVSGYRIDVQNGSGNWESLNLVTTKDHTNYKIGGVDSGIQPGEQMEIPYQVFPTQIDNNPNGVYWLPMYYTNWIGKSLVLKDTDAVIINRQNENQALDQNGNPKTVTVDRKFDDVPVSNHLLYGNPYSFRIRLTDVSGGGPDVGEINQDEGPSPFALINFRRYIAPGLLRIDKNPLLLTNQTEFFNETAPGGPFDGSPELAIRRPLISYPAVVFTGKYQSAGLDPIALLMDASNKMKDLAELDELDQMNTLDKTYILTGTPAPPALQKTINKMLPHLAAIRHKIILMQSKIDLNMPDIMEMRNNGRVLGISDPDVTKVEILVEVETLRMDNLNSISGQENYIPLYRTYRTLIDPFDETTTIPVEFRDIHVLNLSGDMTDPFFATATENPDLTMTGINAMDKIVLPTARRVRLTVRAFCCIEGDDSGDSKARNYYGFINNDNHDLDSRFGKTSSFFFYKESADETQLLQPAANIQAIQALYLQPDPVQVFDGSLASLLLERPAITNQPDIIQRLATQLGVESNGLTLTSKKGQRVVFGCSNRIRHSLAPDNSSITFASKTDLINHWLGCLVYRINRDWSWDALQDISFTVGREKKFRKEKKKESIANLGDIEIKHTASYEALQADIFGNIDRSGTTIIFIDAIEPKASPKGSSTTAPFPDELLTRYHLTPDFKPGHGALNDNLKIDKLILPATTIPAQVPRLVSAGIALSPYLSDDKYSSTAPRQRYLWLEFDEPVSDPDDTLFCRVLAYAPDQLISNNHPEQLVAPDEPPLPIDPEYIRTIVPGQTDDMAGLDAMQVMEKSTDSAVHYLLPIPAGMNSESPELFGFFTYEFRIGHGHWPERKNKNLWSTAQGRFGRPLRVTGMQHPAPVLLCTVNRTQELVYVNAPFAKAVFNGKNVTADPPRTDLWGLLYAQVKRADGAAYKNILLDERRLPWNAHLIVDPKEEELYQAELKTFFNVPAIPAQQDTQNVPFTLKDVIKGSKRASFMDMTRLGFAEWHQAEINELLAMYGLPLDSALSVLVVEIYGNITSIREHITNPDIPEFKIRGSDTYTMESLIRDQQKSAAGAAGQAGAEQAMMLDRSSEEQTLTRQQSVQPLGSGLGNYRILRTSPLTPVPGVCCSDCKEYTTAN
jgi:hypothetical protein